MTEPIFRFLIAVEGPSDARRLRTLLDEVTRRTAEPIEWCQSYDSPDQLIGTYGLDPAHPTWFDLHKVGDLEREVYGEPKFGRSPAYGKDFGRGEIRLLRRFLRAANQTCIRSPKTFDAVIWLRDTDGSADLEKSLVDAIAQDRGDGRRNDKLGPCVIGCPHQCFEAWIVLGLSTLTAPSSPMRVRATHELGFDPFAHPEKLHHKSSSERSAKAFVEATLKELRSTEDEALRSCLSASGTASDRWGRRSQNLAYSPGSTPPRKKEATVCATRSGASSCTKWPRSGQAEVLAWG